MWKFNENCWIKDAASGEKMPDRLIEMAAEHPGVEVPADEDANIDIIFHNKGRSDEAVKVWIAELPKGEAKLTVILTGTYGLEVGTPNQEALVGDYSVSVNFVLILIGFFRVKGSEGNPFTFRAIGMGGIDTHPFHQKRFRTHPFAGSRFLAHIIPDFFAYRTDRQNIFV